MNNLRKRPAGRTGIALTLVLLVFAAGGAAQSAEPGAGGAEPRARYQLATEGLIPSGIWRSKPVFADVNGDGRLDLAANSRRSHGLQVWLGDGRGVWREASVGLQSPDLGCGGGLDVADVNRDGHLDIAVADLCEGVFVFLGDGAGRWRATASRLQPPAEVRPADVQDDRYWQEFWGAEDLALGDINEDGWLDIVAGATKRGGFSVYLGDGSGQSWRRVADHGLPCVDTDQELDTFQGGWVTGLMLRDMNGDGHLDVVATHKLGPRVWLGNGKGQFQPASTGLPTPLVGGLYRSPAVADVNKDGRLDLLVANWINGAELFLQNPDGSWQAAIDPMPALRGGAQAVALADLDGDSHLDVVIGGSRERQEAIDQWGLFVRRGDGRSGWADLPATGLPEAGLIQAWGIGVGDVNQDGRLDLAVTTGSVRAEEVQANPASASQGPGEKPADQGAAAPPAPRLQVWLNQIEPAPEVPR